MAAAEDVETIASEILVCGNCRLCETRILAVPGEGSAKASVMIVGEAPGRNEDETGRPFVGAAGKRLDEVIGLAGLTREDVFVANVLKCRPPKNRNPRKDEIAACRGYLERQISVIRPKVIVTFGNFATQLILGTDEGVSALHGRPVETEVAGGDRPVRSVVYPVFHPASTIYRPQWRAVLEEDMRNLGSVLCEAGAGSD